jgi:hypothetical protein
VTIDERLEALVQSLRLRAAREGGVCTLAVLARQIHHETELQAPKKRSASTEQFALRTERNLGEAGKKLEALTALVNETVRLKS